MRERYWNFFCTIKHKLFYYKHFQILFSRINWLISGFLGIATLSCIAAWDLWKNYQILWAVIICASQIIQALFPKLPYNDLLISTRFMICSLDKLLISIEHDWLYLEYHGMSDDEILEALSKYELQYSELSSQFFSGNYLPNINYCIKKSENECKDFFTVNYLNQ